MYCIYLKAFKTCLKFNLDVDVDTSDIFDRIKIVPRSYNHNTMGSNTCPAQSSRGEDARKQNVLGM